MTRWAVLLLLIPSNSLAHEAAHPDQQESYARQGIAMTAQEVAGDNRVSLRLVDETGNQTPAMLFLARTDSWQQISLEQSFLPNSLHPRRASQRRQWRGKFPIHSDGETELRLAQGHYTLTVGKGLEYHRAKIAFEVVAGQSLKLDVPLRRWIDMPALGWWSGDPHVHVSRPTAASDREILAAAMAEDIHVTSTLEMGDASKMHFPGRGRGEAGRIRLGDYWLVPGQEEPRTDELGHSIMLNTQRLYRDTEHYYLYDRLFSRARADGAVTGLAHFFYAKFHSYRAGALLLPDGLVDFVELLDNSDIFSPGQYYDALNLGFQLPVSAGSDYPWGEHIGDQRTYVQLPEGEALDPQAWYQGLKAGRSFITQGPLLDFTINGQGPGSTLAMRRGDKLNIRAQAQAPPYIGAAKHLRVISMSEELASISRPDRSAEPLLLAHEDTVTESRWYVVVAEAHNGALAHSSPIYVQVDELPARLKGRAFRALVDQQLGVLGEMRGDIIPKQHRSAAYEAWLARIEAYYTRLGLTSQLQ